MKKILAILLCLMLILTAVGCAPAAPVETGGKETGNSEPPTDAVEATGFRVGFARLEIQPEESVPLHGYGNVTKRMSTGFLDELYATCIAITDESDTTVLLFAVDNCLSYSQLTNEVRVNLNELTGIPKGNIMVTSSHTHSGPSLGATSVNSINNYREKYVRQLVQAGLDAMEDRLPAEIYVGDVEAEGLNFVRHYKLANDTYAGDNYGDFNSAEIVGHATESDPTLHLIRFARSGGKDVVMSNWRSHPTITGGAAKYDISADFIAPLRETVEKELDCLFAYFQGDAGNYNPRSKIVSEDCTREYWQYGQQLAAFAITGLKENMTPVGAGQIKINQMYFEGKVNHTTDAMLPQAREVATVWQQTNNYAAAVAAGGDSGIHSPYHANAIIARAAKEPTVLLELNAIAIGDSVGFVTAPNELFDTNCLTVKEKSPYAMTMILGYANDNQGYIPSAFGYEYGCYEADTGTFTPGTGEEIADAFISMLNALNGN